MDGHIIGTGNFEMNIMIGWIGVLEVYRAIFVTLSLSSGLK
jgi:hypothetical protein